MKRKGKSADDLRFINWLRSLSRALDRINTIISDGQQREELSEDQEALVEKLHALYWSEEIRFDKDCINHTELKVS